MEANIIKNALADAVVCDEEIEMIWESFDETGTNPCGKQVFFDHNKDEFEKKMNDFEPILTPFEDYDIGIKNIKEKNNCITVKTDKIIPYETCCFKSTSYHYANGKSVEYVETEYVRMILLFVMPEPKDILRHSFRILKLVSLPEEFIPGKKHKFTVLIPPDFKEFSHCSEKHYLFAYAYNFNYGTTENDKGVEHMFEMTHSFSNTYKFEAFTLN